MGMGYSFAVYLPAALLMFVLTRYLIPYLSTVSGQETVLFWFVVGGIGIFLPLIIIAVGILISEGYHINGKTFVQRLRFRKVTKTDWLWGIGGLLAAGFLSALILKALEVSGGSFDHSPPFMSFEPLTPGRYWLLLVWFPYWILNIMGEELLWRGVMLPRQEVAFGRKAWIVHGLGWWIFHFAFGWHLMLTLLPLIFIQSYIVQRTKNTWVGVIMHGGLNGPSFLAISFGLI